MLCLIKKCLSFLIEDVAYLIYRQWYLVVNRDTKMMSMFTSENMNCYLLKPKSEWWLYRVLLYKSDYMKRCLYCRNNISKDESERINIFIRYHDYNLLIDQPLKYLNKKEFKKHAYHIVCYKFLFGDIDDF
jgi:hypothetical protein